MKVCDAWLRELPDAELERYANGEQGQECEVVAAAMILSQRRRAEDEYRNEIERPVDRYLQRRRVGRSC